MRNVHEFDGKIHMKLENFYTEEQIQKIRNDAEFLSNMKKDARIMATKIMTESAEKNIDPINHHIDARQLFITLLDKIAQRTDEADKVFYATLLEEQLCDMKNLGPCPQGRTIRLWQLIQSIE